MSIQPVIRPVLASMRIAQALRSLRDFELEDARRYREMRERAETSRPFLDRRLRAAIERARTCNHRLVRIQRKLRIAIEGNGDTMRCAIAGGEGA